MKINIENLLRSDPKLIQINRKNRIFGSGLWFRNGVFYFRKVIAGRRFQKSLHTSDPYLALHLANKYKERVMCALILKNDYEAKFKYFLKELGPDFNVDFLNTLFDPNEPDYYKKASKFLEDQAILKSQNKFTSPKPIITSKQYQKKLDDYTKLYNKTAGLKIPNPEKYKQTLLNNYTIINDNTNINNSTEQLLVNLQPTPTNNEVKRSVKEVWEKYKAYHYNLDNPTTELNRTIKNMEEILSYLPEGTSIEDIDSAPQILEQIIDKLCTVKITNGKSKGKNFSMKTIKNKLIPFIATMVYANDNGWIKNIVQIKKKLSVNNYKKRITNAGEDVVPFEENDYNKLFTVLSDIKNNNFKYLDSLESKLNEDARVQFNRIKKHPQAFFYTVLLALYTGSRANACCTLRHQDIDVNSRKINFDNSADDEREKQKKLKTKASCRTLPIPKILIDNNFIEYLNEHSKKYGSESFIFEEAIQTKNSFRPYNINEAFNALLIALDIKPKNSSKNKTFHSIRKSFYTYNELKNHIPTKILKEIAGSSTNTGDVVNDHYMKYTYQDIEEMIDKINYPYQEKLFMHN